MNDIHQEWRELRQKNGDFICHLDGEMAKIEKEKKLLDKQKEQIFYDPITCTYFKADPEEIQKKFESMRKDLMYKSECIAKMTADYSSLIEENTKLQKQLDAAEKEAEDLLAMYDRVQAEAHQAKVAKDRMGYSNRCMQSKIAKQANEIKRLTEENAATKTAYKFLKQALGTSAKDIQIGDEVEVTDKFDPNLDDFGIVIAVYPERRSFEAIGPKFAGCFDEKDIQDGSVKKTGRHFDSIPLDYLA